MKIKSVMKAIIIILGGITAIVLMYMLIFQKKPIININSDDVTKIKVYIAEFGEDERYYRLEFSDRNRIEGLVNEMNNIRARSISEPIKSGDYADVGIFITIYGSKQSDYEYINICGNGSISMREGTRKYKMSDRKGEQFYKYVENLCISDEKCQIKYKALGPWQ